MKTIAVASAIFILLTTSSFTMSSKSQLEQSQNQSQVRINQQDQLKVDQNEGRDFSVLSFNKDGTELMFNECFDAKLINKDAEENERECRIFRLNLANNSLRHYNFPDQDKYKYSEASFSPEGNYVVLKRVPKTDESLPAEEYNELVRENSQKAEICIMNTGGSNFKIIKTTPGIKARPIMSNDETKIAYFRGELRQPGSKTFAANFDIWEIDLKNKTDKLFAGPYKFYGIGQNVQYLKGDEKILVDAYGPKKINNKEYDYSQIYTIKRGEIEVQEPMTMDGVSHLEKPFLTKNGTMFFYGQGTRDGLYGRGLGLIRKANNNKIMKWDAVPEFGYKVQILPTPNEEKVFFIYILNDNDPSRRADLTKNGIAFLDTTNSKWQKFDVPLVSSSLVIPVSTSSQIEIKQPDEQNRSLRKLPNFSLTNPIKLK